MTVKYAATRVFLVIIYEYTGRTQKVPLVAFFILAIGRVSYLIYVTMRHYVLITSGDIVACFYTAVCLNC